MSARDRRLAEKYAAKGMKSASQTKKEKEGRRGRSGEPTSGGVMEALRNFDYNPTDPKQKIQPVPLSEDSKSRARGFKSRLRRLG